MGDLSRWLLHQDQKELFEILFAISLNLFFLALIALLLWPLGWLGLAFRLTKGYGILWIIALMVAVFVNRIQRFLGWICMTISTRM